MNEDINAMAALFSDFNTKIADLEARYEMLKDRVLVTAESFLKTRDSLSKDAILVKGELRDIKKELARNNEAIQSILYELSNLARKEEVKVIEKHMRLFEPLKFTRTEDVRKMIDESLKMHKKEDEIKA